MPERSLTTNTDSTTPTPTTTTTTNTATPTETPTPTATPERVGLALVGLGPGARPHLASLADLKHRVDVRWAVCRNPYIADLGPLAGTVKASAELELALADPAVDVVIVATPAFTHLDIARRCLAAGKHTLVEKPLEVSLERAQSLVAYAEKAGTSFGVVLQHRFRAGALRLRELVDEGALGEIQAASVRVPWWRPQAGYYDQAGRGTRERDGGGVLLTQVGSPGTELEFAL